MSPGAPLGTPSRTPAAFGVGLVLCAAYVLTSPGRVDIIDGQVRFEVAKNWIDVGRPVVLDRALVGSPLVHRTPYGVFGGYNATASVAGMPFILAARLGGRPDAERERFLFTLVGPLFGAVLGGILVFAYGLLGFNQRMSATWALATGLGTLWWPASTTVFDQNQHAVWLLLAVVLAWQSGRRERLMLAAVAGAAGAVLVSYQENYALLLPLAAVATAASPAEGAPSGASPRRVIDRATVARFVTFGLVSAFGLILLVGFNHLRFGMPFYPDRFDNPLLFQAANPLAALLSFAVSPGRSVFLFSPPLLLAVLGTRPLFFRAPALALAVAGISIVHILFIIQLVFFGGDWCWGPRYLLVLTPLWALAFPFVLMTAGRGLVKSLVVAGIVVQVLAVSVDHQRFFLERNLPAFFWATDPWFYFRDSQLLARVGELVTSVRSGVPPEARFFSPTPRGGITYTPAGPPHADIAATWVRHFRVFYLPRPWPLWIFSLDPSQRPINGLALLAVCAGAGAAGAALLATSLGGRRLARSEEQATQPSRDSSRADG